jgi:hypothetical protein
MRLLVAAIASVVLAAVVVPVAPADQPPRVQRWLAKSQQVTRETKRVDVRVLPGVCGFSYTPDTGESSSIFFLSAGDYISQLEVPPLQFFVVVSGTLGITSNGDAVVVCNDTTFPQNPPLVLPNAPCLATEPSHFGPFYSGRGLATVTPDHRAFAGCILRRT